MELNPEFYYLGQFQWIQSSWIRGIVYELLFSTASHLFFLISLQSPSLCSKRQKSLGCHTHGVLPLRTSGWLRKLVGCPNHGSLALTKARILTKAVAQ